MNTLFKITLSLALFICFTSCYVTMSIDGSKNIVEEIRDINSFTSLSIDGVIDVEVIYGEQGQVEVTANDNIMSNVLTEVENGILKIDLKDGNYTNVDIDVKVFTTDLEFISKDGVGTLDLDDMEGLDELEITHDGVGSIVMSGSAERLIYTHDGVGQMNAFSFEVGEVEIRQAGVGSSELFVTDILEGSLSGVGNIHVKGDPAIDVNISGVGKVKDAN